MGEWISVSDELPQPFVAKLVRVEVAEDVYMVPAIFLKASYSTVTNNWKEKVPGKNSFVAVSDGVVTHWQDVDLTVEPS